MKKDSSLLMIGVGGSGCTMVNGILKRYGTGLRHLLVDTDSSSFGGDSPFLLLGAERLAGRGTGGEIVSARLAAEDSAEKIDEFITGVRMAVIVCALGGGTGSGATLELLRHFSDRGIVTVVFATQPFSFEGEARQRNARGINAMIAGVANASFFIPLDNLTAGCEEMDRAMSIGLDRMADAVTMFWRVIERPGYIEIGEERLRHIAQNAGRGRFATTTTRGPGRAARAVADLTSTPLLADGTNAVRTILCGVLAGDDLRLSEIAEVADGLKTAFGGDKCDFELGTVNDEEKYSGDLCVVAMLFELPTKLESGEKPRPTRKQKAAAASRSLLAAGSRFGNIAPTIWNDENLDVPTYLRQNITLEF